MTRFRTIAQGVLGSRNNQTGDIGRNRPGSRRPGRRDYSLESFTCPVTKRGTCGTSGPHVGSKRVPEGRGWKSPSSVGNVKKDVLRGPILNKTFCKNDNFFPFFELFVFTFGKRSIVSTTLILSLSRPEGPGGRSNTVCPDSELRGRGSGRCGV